MDSISLCTSWFNKSIYVSLLTKLHMHCTSPDERPLGNATCLGLDYGTVVEFSVCDATEYSDFIS